MSLLVQLFFSFFQIGLFSIGGGYAAMPLIREQVVDLHGWLTAVEFSDLVTIAEMTPGPISINSATFVGMRVAGIAGVVVATIGNVLPSIIIMLLLARLYERYSEQTLLKRVLEGVRPVVVAAIFTAGIGLLQLAVGSFASPDIFASILFLLGFIALNSHRIKVGPIALLVVGAAAGIGYTYFF